MNRPADETEDVIAAASLEDQRGLTDVEDVRLGAAHDLFKARDNVDSDIDTGRDAGLKVDDKPPALPQNNPGCPDPIGHHIGHRRCRPRP